jgi:hypothetical protein
MTDPAVESVFRASWDRAEEFYLDMAGDKRLGWLSPMAGFVRELRGRGYDRLFRHGHAAYILVLSRSLKHGLRSNQPYVQFLPRTDGSLFIECQLRGAQRIVRQSFTVASIAVTHELDQLIQRLAKEAID